MRSMTLLAYKPLEGRLDEVLYIVILICSYYICITLSAISLKSLFACLKLVHFRNF